MTAEPESLATRASSTDYLDKRIALNKSFSAQNFDAWLLDRLSVGEGMDILDVGCGVGAQTLPISDRVGPTGSVSALDISSESVERLQARLNHPERVQAVAADMADLATVIRDEFRVKRFDLAQSTYALYYARDHASVLDAMRLALKPGGRLAVFAPNAPHGLVDLATRFSSVPAEVTDCMVFGPNVLAPYFKRNFAKVDVHHFHNVVTLPNAETLIEFYRQTTYYDAAAEPKIRAHVEDDVRRNGAFVYEKNGYLIIGSANE